MAFASPCPVGPRPELATSPTRFVFGGYLRPGQRSPHPVPLRQYTATSPSYNTRTMLMRRPTPSPLPHHPTPKPLLRSGRKALGDLGDAPATMAWGVPFHLVPGSEGQSDETVAASLTRLPYPSMPPQHNNYKFLVSPRGAPKSRMSRAEDVLLGAVQPPAYPNLRQRAKSGDPEQFVPESPKLAPRGVKVSSKRGSPPRRVIDLKFGRLPGAPVAKVHTVPPKKQTTSRAEGDVPRENGLCRSFCVTPPVPPPSVEIPRTPQIN
mmetsp:Transcript_72776/g.194239  ORF Transcript_72776/g.194239 Transcript_72776/m.194239 type:complete len:265 (+) Transcript_72776:73-867(+)